MKNLINTEAELKKTVFYKKSLYFLEIESENIPHKSKFLI